MSESPDTFPTRAEFARQAEQGVANHWDDKLDHLLSAIEALQEWVSRADTPASPSINVVLPKISQLRQRLNKMIIQRHAAVQTAYDLAWAQYDAYRFLQGRSQ